MEFNAYPGYEFHLNMYDIMTNGTEEQKKEAMMTMQKFIRGYKMPEGMEMKDIIIEGPDKNDLKLRIYRPAGLPENSPILMDIHGGGWVSGDLDIDNYRCIYLAEHTPCLVVSVEYRLSTKEVHFPAPLMDCYTALNWIHDHAAELKADGERIAIHGTSAGANLVAGLALYVRDHGGPAIALQVMNCPALTLNTYPSSYQNVRFTMRGGVYNQGADFTYIGEENFNGGIPNCYAMPGYCVNLEGVAPAYIVVAEYDTLRDDGIAYATKLLRDGVSTEMILAPGVGHGFCVCDLPLTHWIHNGICASLRRRFGMPVTEF